MKTHRGNVFLLWLAVFIMLLPIYLALSAFAGMSVGFAASQSFGMSFFFVYAMRKNPSPEASPREPEPGRLRSPLRVAMPHLAAFVGVFALGTLARLLRGQPSWETVGIYAVAVPAAMMASTFLFRKALKPPA